MKRALILFAAVSVVAAVSPSAMARQDVADSPGETPASTSPKATEEGPEINLADLLRSGGRRKGAQLAAAIDKAASHPLGSKENPVRVSRPQGQQGYLRRLRCSDDRAPRFERVGNFGPGVFGSIIDGYKVTCAGGAAPAESMIFMDMYHPDHDETGPPPGFTFKARARQP
jgi:hypothetical protein